MAALAEWENFYVIAGSSAGALIGLQFVALSLIVSRPDARVDAAAGEAFSTPTVIHFGTVLLLSGILTAPWQGMAGPTVGWGVIGLTGVVYAITITRRMRKQTAYRPEFEDWLFHVLLPSAAYITLAASAWAARSHFRESLFGVGGASLLLLFVGIHNAWDAVTYHVYSRSKNDRTNP